MLRSVWSEPPLPEPSPSSTDAEAEGFASAGVEACATGFFGSEPLSEKANQAPVPSTSTPATAAAIRTMRLAAAARAPAGDRRAGRHAGRREPVAALRDGGRLLGVRGLRGLLRLLGLLGVRVGALGRVPVPLLGRRPGQVSVTRRRRRLVRRLGRLGHQRIPSASGDRKSGRSRRTDPFYHPWPTCDGPVRPLFPRSDRPVTRPLSGQLTPVGDRSHASSASSSQRISKSSRSEISSRSSASSLATLS